jgi:hypothetical protein
MAPIWEKPTGGRRLLNRHHQVCVPSRGTNEENWWGSMCKALFTYAEDLVVSLNPALAFCLFPKPKKKTQRIKTICHIHVTYVVPVILPEKNMKLQFPSCHSFIFPSSAFFSLVF